MPTKKQRRRREKDRRHEWEYVYVDDTGQEVEVDEEPASAASAKTPKGTRPTAAAAKGSAAKKPARQARVPQEPSWSRSAKRALPWQGVMVLLVLVLFRSEPIATRIFFALIYGVAFVPFTYWVEKLAWQRHLRATGKLPPADKKPRKKT